MTALSALIAMAIMAGSASAQRADTVDQLFQKIDQAAATGQYQQGLSYSNQLEPIVRRRWGEQSMNFAAVRHNQAMFLHNLGRYSEAADKLAQALQIKDASNDVGSLLRTSNLACSTYLLLGRMAEATAISQRALNRATTAFGPNDRRLAGPLSCLGKISVDRSAYADAERYLQRVVTLQEAVAPQDPEALADALDELGNVLGLEGRFAEAEAWLKRAVSLLDQRFGKDAVKVANYDVKWNSLGNLYTDQGRYREAEAAFRRAIAVARAQTDVNQATVAAFTGNLATALNSMSRFAEAETLYKQVLLVDEKTFGPDHSVTAVALNNLANNYQDQGRFSDAVGLQQRSLSIDQKVYGPESGSAAKGMANLANAYSAIGDREGARKLYERSLSIMARLYGEDSLQIVILLNSIASLDREEGRLDEAAQHLNRAMTIVERTSGQTSVEMVQPLRGLAFVDIKRGQYDDASAKLERALQIAEVTLGAGHRTTLATLVNMAEAASQGGKWAQALAFLRRASAAREQGPANGTGDSAAVNRGLGIDAARVDALWHVADGRPDMAQIDEAFVATQRANETRTSAALGQMAARFGAGNDSIASLIRRQQDLQFSLAGLDKRITSELGLPKERRSDALIASLRIEAAAAQKSYDETTARITKEFPTYAELATPLPLTIAQARALLGADEVLVSFLSLDTRSFVFAVTNESAAWREVALGSAALNERVAALRKGLSNRDANKGGPFDLHAAHALYDALFGPIAATVNSKEKLVVVTTGALTSLPLQVLVTKEPNDSLSLYERYRQAAWLINDKAITVLPAVSSLRALRVFARSSKATKPFVGFGNPVFNPRPDDSGQKQRSAVVGPYKDFFNGASVDIDLLRKRLPPLPDTENELRAVAKALGATEADLYLGAAASLTNVEAAKLTDYRVVDFATHGLVAGDVEGLSEPALVLSLPIDPMAADNGLLTVSRVARLLLDADWAVLSACNTAAGDSPGAEGLSGLARAFFYAGARSLLVSNWPVDSEAAVKLTTRAFGELAAKPAIGRAEALRRSMRTLIADRSDATNADPAVWAPFVLVGEGSR